MALQATARPPLILPGKTDRAVFCGATGSGKTQAMLSLAAHYYGKKQIIIIDTKADSGIKRLKSALATSLTAMMRFHDPVKYPLVTFRPTGAMMKDPTTFDDLFEWVYMRGKTLVLIDEASQVCANKTYPSAGLLDMVTRGRDRGVQVWSATQRPVAIPVILLSEAEHIFCFELRRKADKKVVDDYTHDGFTAAIPESDHDHGVYPFAYFTPGKPTRVYRNMRQAL